MRLKLLAIFTLITSSPAWSNETSSEGIKAYRQGNYQKAEQLYRQALTEETDRNQLAAIYRNLSLLYNVQGKDGSEFAKKADELNPPAKSTMLMNDANSVLINNNPVPSTVHSEGPLNRFEQQSSPVPTDSSRVPQQSDGSGQAAYGSPSIYGSSSFRGSSLGGSFGLNSLRGSGGGLLNGGMSSRSANGFYGTPAYGPVNGGSYFSSVTPNSTFQYSTNTPIVLPKPDGGAVILNNPGPNIYSSQQAPDGSTTVIMKRTY